MARSALVVAFLAALAATAFAAPDLSSTSVASKDSSDLSFPGLDLLNDLLNTLQCAADDADGIGNAVKQAVANTRTLLAAAEGFKSSWQSCGGLDIICKLKVIETATSNVDAAQKDIIDTLETFQSLLAQFKECKANPSSATLKVKA